ncbi:MAG: hypothetical protein C4533_03090 [Candidatus Omnitrophota bacterium]|jgi:hypothetical protein|nr:MAG: hypothetical protein C4533_03090 [Candidatus Omnitrophota bacterium]
MKTYLKPIIYTLVFALILIYPVKVLAAKETKSIPLHFFAVHCEPTTAFNRMFETLCSFVQLADTYKIKLTIEFTPQWANMILSDKQKLSRLRSWQNNGHEIAGHHHPATHKYTWDGYSDDKNKFNDPRFKGTMQDYADILNRLAYPLKINTLGNPDINDWVQGVPYRTEGFVANNAVSAPVKSIIKGTTVYTLGYGFLGGKINLVKLKKIYNAFKGDQVFGVVTHVFNFDENPGVIEEWFKFISENDPQGKNNLTVSQIMNNKLKRRIDAEN